MKKKPFRRSPDNEDLRQIIMKKSILIVDDDIVSLKLAGMILSQGNYEIHRAKSGIDAISFLKRQKVDLILLDIEMPMMNGIKTLEKMRSDNTMAKIPVIILTSSGEKENVVSAARFGIVDYIKKPFVPNDLLERVWRAL